MRATFWVGPFSALAFSACFQADANDFIISCEDDGLCPEGFLCANDVICENEEFLLPSVDPVILETPFPFALVTGKSLGGAELRVFVDGDEVIDTVVDPDPDPFIGVGDFAVFVPLNNGNNQLRIEVELQGVVEISEVDLNGAPLEVDLDANTNLFTDVAALRGLGFAVPSLTNNADKNNQGATFQDVDNDGDLDLLIGSDPLGRLRENDGEGDFSAGAALQSHIAASFADVDQDGDLDVALSATPNPAVNNADFAAVLFNDLDGEADFGGAQFATDASNSEGAVFFEGADAGFVDVLFQDGGENRIQRSNNDGANFNIQDRDAALSSKDAGNVDGNGSFATACDVDFDGNVDLLINDAPNFQLFESLGNGNFDRVAGNFLIADGNNRGRGLLFADFNKDGAFEIAVAFGGNGIGIVPININAGNIIPGPVEIIQVNSDGISAGDLDLDGDLDLIASDDNGNDRFLVNQGGVQGGILGQFVELVGALDSNTGGNGEGVALGDIDNDGDLDIFIADQLVDSRLYENQIEDVHSRRLRVVRAGEDGADVDIIGAVVTLFENVADDDPRVFAVQQVDGGSGHGSQEPLNLFFGGAAPRRAYIAEIQIPGCNDPIETILQPADVIFRFEECP